MRARMMWWALAFGVAVVVAPGALTAVERAATRPVAEAETMRPVRPEAGVGGRSSAGGGATTTTAPAVATTAAPSGGAGAQAAGGGGRCDPYCSDLSALPPPPQITYDPFANCPHRWQVDPTTGQRIDTGCGSEPIPPVAVVVVPPATAPPPVVSPAPPPTSPSTVPPPPPTTAPTTAAPPP